MSEQLLAVLKSKLDGLTAYGGMDAETRRNALKEELQYYLLNFIYHHPRYSRWVMYGGSALRMIHGLDRMSVDLDFEVSDAITEEFLKKLKKEIEDHFSSAYNARKGFLTIKTVTGRGLLLKFDPGGELNLGHPSKQVHVKIDLNCFNAPKGVRERRPVNHGQLSFVIVTYNMATLMASKVAAIFLRGPRGVGKALYKEKGRDIYDLLWYMNNKIAPALDYLKAKNVKEAEDLRVLFDRLTIKMNEVTDENLRQDLLPFFLNRTYIENWIKNWRESYRQLLNDYKIRTVTELEGIDVRQDLNTDNYFFIYQYRTTEEGKSVRVKYAISEYWVEDVRDLPEIGIDAELIKKIEFPDDSLKWSSRPDDPQDRVIKKYATLFYQKIEKYLEKTNRVVLGRNINTKMIRMSAEHLNQKEEILLNKSALISCELEDLLR